MTGRSGTLRPPLRLIQSFVLDVTLTRDGVTRLWQIAAASDYGTWIYRIAHGSALKIGGLPTWEAAFEKHQTLAVEIARARRDGWS